MAHERCPPPPFQNSKTIVEVPIYLDKKLLVFVNLKIPSLDPVPLKPLLHFRSLVCLWDGRETTRLRGGK